MEQIADGWMRHVSKLLKIYKDKEPEEYTPMAEYALWQEKENEFNSILEQFKNPFVLNTLEKLQELKSEVIKAWPNCILKLKNAHSLSKENSDYLSTLQEYLLVSQFNIFGISVCVDQISP